MGGVETRPFLGGYRAGSAIELFFEARDGVEGDIQDFTRGMGVEGLLEILGMPHVRIQGGADGFSGLESLAIGFETFSLGVDAAFDFDGDDVAAVAAEKIDFRLGVFFFAGPVAGGERAGGAQFLLHVLFGEGALEVIENEVAVQQGAGVQVADGSQQAYINKEYFADAGSPVGGHGELGRFDARDRVNQPCVLQPSQGVLEGFATGSAQHFAVYEALVFFGELLGDGFPEQVHVRQAGRGGVFAEISPVTGQQVLLHVPHGGVIAGADVGVDRFGHAAYIEIGAQEVDVVAGKGVDEAPVSCFYQAGKGVIAGGYEELPERHGVEVQPVDFANGEASAHMVCHAQKGAGGDDGIFACFFAEVFQGGQGCGAFLDFIQYDECVIGIYRAFADDGDGFKDALDIKICAEGVSGALVVVESDVGDVLEILPTEFLHQPCLADLASTHEEKRFPPWIPVPDFQLLYGESLHGCRLVLL